MTVSGRLLAIEHRVVANHGRHPQATGHPALKAGAAHKKRFEAWLAEALGREGVSNASVHARSIVVLLDGAAAVMLIHRDPAYVEAAGAVAASLVEPSNIRLAAARPRAVQRRP